MEAPSRVLITGVSSFVGHHLALRFAALDDTVIGVTTRPRAAYAAERGTRLARQHAAGVAHATADLCDDRALRALIADTRPDVVVHHAAWAQGQASRDYDLARGFATNVAPLRALYEALDAVGCRRLILTATCAEYTDGDAPHTEDERCEPTLPYGLAKLAATLRAAQLARQLGLSTRVVRIFTPFGPLDAPGKLLPSALRALLGGTPIALSHGRQIRDFLHVDDLVAAYVALARAPADPDRPFDVFNVSRGEGHSLKQLLAEVAAAADADPTLLQWGARPARADDVAALVGDSTKAQRALGWRPTPLADSVARYVAAERSSFGSEPPTG